MQALISAVEEDEDMEEEIQPMHSVVKFPEYVPLFKGKAKVPKDLDATKSTRPRSSPMELPLRVRS